MRGSRTLVPNPMSENQSKTATVVQCVCGFIMIAVVLIACLAVKPLLRLVLYLLGP